MTERYWLLEQSASSLEAGCRAGFEILAHPFQSKPGTPYIPSAKEIVPSVSLGLSPRRQRIMHLYSACHGPQQQIWELHRMTGNCRALWTAMGFPRKAVLISQARSVFMMSDLGMLCEKGMFPRNSTLPARKQLFQVPTLYLSHAKTNCSISDNSRDFSVAGHRQSQLVHRRLIISTTVTCSIY